MPIIDNYVYSDRKPIGDDIITVLNEEPRLKDRRNIINKIKEIIRKFVSIFEDQKLSRAYKSKKEYL